MSELAATHIGPTLQAGGLENLLESMDVDSTITRMTDGIPHWVALEDGAIVGIAVVKPPSHIYHLFVRSDRQRTGIGRRLMDEALWFISDRCGRATVTVNSSLNAVNAYRRFGFRDDGDEVVDDAGVRFQPMSRDLPACLLKQGYFVPDDACEATRFRDFSKIGPATSVNDRLFCGLAFR